MHLLIGYEIHGDLSGALEGGYSPTKLGIIDRTSNIFHQLNVRGGRLPSNAAPCHWPRWMRTTGQHAKVMDFRIDR